MRAAFVIVDEEERKSMMAADIRAIEERTGARGVAGADLLDEIMYITEQPHGLMGRFEKGYLGAAQRVLVNA